MNSRSTIFLIVAALVSFHSNSSVAQETVASSLDEDRELSVGLGIPDSIDFHGYIGIAVGAFPEYEGSDEAGAVVLPLVDIRQPDFLFVKGANVNPNDGYASIGWNALNLSYTEQSEPKLGLLMGPIVRLSRGRDEDDNSALNGLGDIDSSVGLGGFIETKVGNWSTELTAVSQDAGETGDGLLVAVRSSYAVQIGERFSIVPGVFTSWVDDDYMQGFYGVDASQASRSGLAPFNAEAGFKDVGLEIGASYDISSQFAINGQLAYQRLLGDAADSPIVDSNGSRDQARALIGASYKF